MWMLVPIAFALKLLNVFLQPLGSVWSSLGPLFLQLRAASWLAGGERSRPLQDRREAGEPGRAEGEDGGDLPTTPTSVNYHFTRQCNYKCGFCFHTAKTSFVLPLEEAKKGLLMLKEAGESPDPGKPSGAQSLQEGRRGWVREQSRSERFPRNSVRPRTQWGCIPARGGGGELWMGAEIFPTCRVGCIREQSITASSK